MINNNIAIDIMLPSRKRGPPDRYIDEQSRQIQRDKEIRMAKAKEAIRKKSDEEEEDNVVNTVGIIPTGKYKIMYLDFVKAPDLTKPTTYPLLITQDNFSLINVLNNGIFDGFILPPGGTADFRGMFSDLNRILIAQQRLSLSDDSEVTLRVTTSANCNNTGPRAVRDPTQQWYNMCFYCGKHKGTKDLQCDHVIPIMQMFVSVEPTQNIFYNFESVHRVCNNKAKNMSLEEIWNKIGTKEFPGPNGYSDAILNYQINGTPLAISTSSARQELCRGYLAYQVLNKLTFYDRASQLTRRDQLERVAVKYKDFKSTVEDQYLSEVGSAASILMDLSSDKRSKTTSFGKPQKSIKLVRINKLQHDDKKYEAVFSVNGEEKKQKFGASGMSDYTLHRDIKRRNLYINRHIKDLTTGDPTRAGFLSMYILWNYPNLSNSIKDYKARLKIYNTTGKFPLNIDKFITKEGYTVEDKLQTQFSTIKSVQKFGLAIPSNVTNSKLYKEIKDKIKKSIHARRWGAYDSGRLVQEYKAAGGTYTGSKKNTRLDRWYKEKWINTCKLPKIVPCGREDMNKPIAYCRPLIRVTKDTPKTATELSTQEIISRCRRKRTNPLKIIK